MTGDALVECGDLLKAGNATQCLWLYDEEQSHRSEELSRVARVLSLSRWDKDVRDQRRYRHAESGLGIHSICLLNSACLA